MEPQTVEIPSFTLDEALVIERLFRANGIGFSRVILSEGGYYSGPWVDQWTFRVSADQFHRAIGLLKDHYGLQPEADGTTAECPACGAPMRGEPRCPACDLNVAAGMASVHPFAFFLKRHGLL